jgi:hypothetical protein
MASTEQVTITRAQAQSILDLYVKPPGELVHFERIQQGDECR